MVAYSCGGLYSCWLIPVCGPGLEGLTAKKKKEFVALVTESYCEELGRPPDAGLGFRVQRLGCRVLGLGLRVQGVGFRV